jgi:serine/threonine-protein kinase HipA
VAEVRLWGRTIGAVSLRDGEDVAEFEYAADFADSGIEISPLHMPLSRRVFSFPALARESFHGLPGLLADSLPDRFGNALIDAWLARQGRTPDSMNSVERLCYTGSRGMGAMEFSPASGPAESAGTSVEIEHLVELASLVLTDRGGLRASLADDERTEALGEILRVGTSAGGARAKAVLAWNPSTGEVRSGQVDTEAGFEHWLLKFDGVSVTADERMADPQGFGAVEYAYHRMAVDAGIEMTECRLLEEGGRRHFMTRRFDRTPTGAKRHMQTLGALGHFDFNLPGATSYEQALLLLRQLELDMDTTEQLFRRAVFNVIARNQDDHVKNIAFLMDRRGDWSLAPAYDVTYAFNPAGMWTSRHQMSLNGKRDAFTLDDFEACARTASMKGGRAKTIYAEVRDVVHRWPEYADEVGVAPGLRAQIANALRLTP